jgi:hypothetical protein
MKFMWNCAMSQAEAELVSASSKRWVQIGGRIVLGPGMPPPLEADAYAYVTGKPFFQYGGEQIAQQIEDAYFYAARLLYSDSAAAQRILTRMKAIPPGPDPDNIAGLSSTKYALKSERNVVWHDDYGQPVYANP